MSIIYIFTILLLIYTLGITVFYYHWYRMEKSTISSHADVFVSIVIVMRNEADNLTRLLKSIEEQDYPKDQYELIIIDDDSTDQSAQIVKDFSKKATFLIRLMDNNANEHIASFKKRAITSAIDKSNGGLIACTDADCVVPKAWLSLFVGKYRQGMEFISGGVTFHKGGIFEHLQSVEFASLIGSGASCLALGSPTMCNGANLAYSKKAFQSVKGYEGVEHLASGDDEFLMHKIAQQFPDKVCFLKNPLHIVRTNASLDLSSFFQQRIRWASKWEQYKSLKTKGIALLVFMSNLGSIILHVLLALGYWGQEMQLFLGVFVCRFLVEYFFLKNVLRHLHKKGYHLWTLPLYLIYPYYVVIFGLLGRRFGYTWKGRKLS